MRDECDDEGFPPPCEENAGNLYLDAENGVVYVCVFEDHPEIMDWCWVTVGNLW